MRSSVMEKSSVAMGANFADDPVEMASEVP